MSRPGIDRMSSLEASTLEKSHPDSLLIAIRNIYIWSRDCPTKSFKLLGVLFDEYLSCDPTFHKSAKKSQNLSFVSTE